MNRKNTGTQNGNNQNRQAMPGQPSYEDIAAARKISFSDIREHLAGPVVSLIVHVILLAICFTFIVSAPDERKEIAVEIKEFEVMRIEKLPPPPPEERIELEKTVELNAPRSNLASAMADDARIAPSSFLGKTDTGVGFSDALDVPVSNVLNISPSDSPLVLPGAMSGRSKGGIKTALQKYNRGGGATERSVSRGLSWLKDHQNADGSWGEGSNRIPALTALATLAFLAHGETPGSQEYGACVLKAIRKLIEYGSTSDANGLIKNSGKGYGHAMVAYALSEAYALTKIPMIEEPMNRTINRIITGQNSLGSYNYLYGNGSYRETGKPRCDLSLAGWNYQALKAASAAGCTVKGLDTAIDNGVKGIQKVHYTGEGFAYRSADGKGGGTPTMTSVGVLCLQLMGQGRSKEALTGLKYIETGADGSWMKCDWQAGRNNSLYQWYYQTQAIFQGYSGTGGTWDRWNTEFQKALMKEQESDGHWSSPSEKYGKAGMETGKGRQDKDVKDDDDSAGTTQNGSFASTGNIDLYIYSTSLCCLMLEVYYRYLPTFKVAGHVAEEGTLVKKDTKDELKIE